MFLRMVNFYRDLWLHRSHILAPLNKMARTKTKKDWYWTKSEQTAFMEAKEMLMKETLLAFPDFTKPFHVYMDASNRQLRATVVQEGKPLGFYTRKLNPTQKNYTVGERELLGIVEGLKAFEGILRGQDVTIHTDHLNLLYQKCPTQPMVHWRLMLEEFHPKVLHVAGKENNSADAFSTLDMADNTTVKLEWEPPLPPLRYQDEVWERIQLLFPMTSERKLKPPTKFPLAHNLIKYYQQKDTTTSTPTASVTVKSIEGEDLVHHNGKIYIPPALQPRVLDWYHTMLVHLGETRMEKTIRSVRTCQLFKKSGQRKYGLLPAKNPETTKWRRVNVDLVWGLPTVKNKNGNDYKVHVMTMIDWATGWFEVAALRNGATALEAQRLLDSQWLARYPRPREIGFDGGNEFKAEFLELCANMMGIKTKPSGVWNPQSNSVLESVHQVLGNCLRSFNLEQKEFDPNDPFEEFLTTAAYVSIQSSHHTTLGYSPAQLVFGRDMFMPVNFQVDWEKIKANKQNRILKNNKRENLKRKPHTYSVGDLVTVERLGIIPNKLSFPWHGPNAVTAVHDNGSVTIPKEPFVTD